MRAFLARKKMVNDAIRSHAKSKNLTETQNNQENKSKKEIEKKKEKNEERELKIQNRNIVLNYVAVERSKEPSSQILKSEYTEKVILYGYLIVIKKILFLTYLDFQFQNFSFLI